MYWVYFQINMETQDPVLVSLPPESFSDCLVCERDIETKTFTFFSTTAEYKLLTSPSQLPAFDYSQWVSWCLGKLFILY